MVNFKIKIVAQLRNNSDFKYQEINIEILIAMMDFVDTEALF